MSEPSQPCTIQVVIDCTAPHELADWWAETLGWDVEPQDEAFIRSMIDQGHASDDDTISHKGSLVWTTGAAINPPEPRIAGQTRILFQQVPEAKAGKNRIHLDLRPGPPGTVDLDALRQQLTDRGATEIGRGRQGPHDWVTFVDPEGNEFCV